MTGRCAFAGELEVSQRHVDGGLKLFESKLRRLPSALHRSHPAVCGMHGTRSYHWLRGRPECGAAMRGAGRFTCD